MDAKTRQRPEAEKTKPGERKPPPRVPAVKAEPERKKPGGIGGAPSPVGENDLA